MLARKLIAAALVCGITSTGIASFAGAQDKKSDKKPESASDKKIEIKVDGTDMLDEELQEKVMAQVKKALQKIEDKLGEEKIDEILQKVEQGLGSKLNEFEFEFKGFDPKELKGKLKMVEEKLGNLDAGKLMPRVIQLQDEKQKRRVIGIMLKGDKDSTVEIQQVMKGSAAEEAGLKAGDVIYKINGKKAKNATDLVDEVRESDGAVKLQIERDDKKKVIVVKPKVVSATNLSKAIIDLEDLESLEGLKSLENLKTLKDLPMLKLEGGDGVFKIHKDMIWKVSPEGLKSGKGIFFVKPDEEEEEEDEEEEEIEEVEQKAKKKVVEWKIDRAADKKRLMKNRTADLKKRVEVEVEIEEAKEDIERTIKDLKAQMKKLQDEIKQLKKKK